MKIPGIGEVMEEGGANGRLWRVVGVRLADGVEEEHPERKALYIDLDPVKDRPAVPDAFREAALD